MSEQIQKRREETSMAGEQSIAHQVFMEHYDDLSTSLVSSTGTLSSKLWEQNIIPDELYDSITDNTLAAPNHERTRILLKYIHKTILKRKSSQQLAGAETSAIMMKKFMKILQDEPAWHDLLKDVDASLEQAKKDSDIDCPEAEALKRNMDNLISRLSGSLVSVASAAYSARLLAPNEKDIADPSAGKQHIYAVELLDEVGNRIKKKPKTFDEFVIILKDLGGILTDISDEMKAKKEDRDRL